MSDRIIRITTAVAVVAVAAVAGIVSYQHAYELVREHGESGATAQLLPFIVDGLIWAASMVILDASRRRHRVPPLAAWSLAAAIIATIGANLAQGLGHGPIGALVSAWPALALVGSSELLMMLIRTEPGTSERQAGASAAHQAAPGPEQGAPPPPDHKPTVEQTVQAWHDDGRSQRAIARELSIDRRKVRQIIDPDPCRLTTKDPAARHPAGRSVTASTGAGTQAARIIPELERSARGSGLTDRSFLPIGMAADLRILYSSVREIRVLSARVRQFRVAQVSAPKVPSTHPIESSGFPSRPMPHLHSPLNSGSRAGRPSGRLPLA
jgi:Protein of unknown function (DUF2637)